MTTSRTKTVHIKINDKSSKLVNSDQTEMITVLSYRDAERSLARIYRNPMRRQHLGRKLRALIASHINKRLRVLRSFRDFVGSRAYDE